MIAALQS